MFLFFFNTNIPKCSSLACPQDTLPTAFLQPTMRSVKGNTTKYKPELRQFALTLHFYSPKAYKYVWKVWKNLFPHPSTLQRWCCTRDLLPGFSEETLQFVGKSSIAHEQNSQTKIICNLCIDEMSIRQQLVLKNDKKYGCIDLGFGNGRLHDEVSDPDDLTNEDELPPLAKNVLVFLLVALNAK